MGWIIAILVIIIIGTGSVSTDELENPFLTRTIGFVALVILIAIIFASC